MERPVVDIIIPVYKPDHTLCLLLQKLQEQTFVVHKVILANTEETLWNAYVEQTETTALTKRLSFPVEVFHVAKKDFDHGGTRRLAVERSDAPYFVCMTQDVRVVDEYLLESLLQPFQKPKVAVTYGRQQARDDCSPVEAYTRSFNYPPEDRIKSGKDLERLGIKTFFCSDVCAAYRRDIYEELGGFEEHAIFNEDMIYAGHAVLRGYRIAYAAGAKVIHSHNYTGRQQYRRNFDLAVSQVQHPEVFSGIRSESEGIRMVKDTVRHLFRIKKPWLIPYLIWQSGWKYLGYRAGKKYRTMKRNTILRRTMNPAYWQGLWERERLNCPPDAEV